MNREVHVRFCERFRGETPLYLLDFIVGFNLILDFITLKTKLVKINEQCSLKKDNN